MRVILTLSVDYEIAQAFQAKVGKGNMSKEVARLMKEYLEKSAIIDT